MSDGLNALADDYDEGSHLTLTTSEGEFEAVLTEKDEFDPEPWENADKRITLLFRPTGESVDTDADAWSLKGEHLSSGWRFEEIEAEVYDESELDYVPEPRGKVERVEYHGPEPPENVS